MRQAADADQRLLSFLQWDEWHIMFAVRTGYRLGVTPGQSAEGIRRRVARYAAASATTRNVELVKDR